MAVFVMVGLWLGRGTNPLAALSLAVIFLLTVDPGLAVDIGFGLSALAIAGLLVLAELAPKTLVTKVAHHGSADQSRRFYRALDSEYLVFSVGKNDYGHPANSALSLAWQSSAEILRTDKLGHIAMGHDQELRYRYSGKLTA